MKSSSLVGGTPVVLVLGVLVLGLFACNSKSPETTELGRSDGLVSGKSGLPDSQGTQAKSGAPELEPALPTLSKPHFSAFDLLTNRPLAHRVEEAHTLPTIAVDATSLDFTRYSVGNHATDWFVAAKVDGGVVSATRGRAGRLWIPALRPEQSQELRIRIFNPARGHNSLTVNVNGVNLPELRLVEGWQTVSAPLEAGGPLRSDNDINFTFSNMGRIEGNLSGGGIAWLRLGAPTAAMNSGEVAEDVVEATADGARADAIADGLDDAVAGEEEAEGQGSAESNTDSAKPTEPLEEPFPSDLPMKQGALTLEPGSGAAWFVWLPEGAQLDMQVEATEGCGPAVQLFTESGKGGVASKLSEVRNLVLGRGGVQETAIDLSEFAGQVARLEIRPSDACESALTLKRAALVVPGERPTVPKVAPPKYVLFWMIDTLRADHLPIHFETDVQAPNLKRLAEEGASFRVAFVQGTESRASHASLFTGEYPSRHRVLGRGRVNAQTPLLQESFQKAGYRTGAYNSNGYVSHLLSLDRGWNFFTNNIHQETGLDAMFMARQGIRWATENKEAPFFLYLGTIDPHVTYRRHADIIDIYDTEPYSGRFQRFCSGEDLGLIKGRKLQVSDRDKLRIHNLYKNEVTYNDRGFGFLREQLEEAGIWDETLVVVTADHGDEFWERGSVGHGHNVNQEMVHVPLILYYPPLFPAGTVIEAGADVLDIFPTLLDVIGQEQLPHLQGKSLLPLVHNVHGGYPEPAIATLYLRHYAMQKQDWKLHLRRGEYSIYDRRTDVLALNDVGDDHPLATRWLLDSMGWFREYRTDWNKSTWGVPGNLSPDFLAKIKK